jgi:bacillithiol biosynthesis deacetylase BshB1
MKLDAMAFGAHVDDIELSCGGTLAKLVSQGYAIGACELTSGELSTRGTVAERSEEAQAAAKILGLAPRINLSIPDGNVAETEENKLAVIKVIRQYRPRFIFAPYWKCRHFDHVHASNVVSEASFYSGLAKIDTGQQPHRPDFIFYYFLRHETEPSFVVDISGEFETKKEAIMAHKSQFHNENSEEPDTFISSKFFIDSIENRNKYWGLRIGTNYGEPFVVKETIKIDDPLAHFGKMDSTRIMATSSSDS